MSIGDREYVISLTGKDSHKVMIPAGQGSFSIGTKGLSEGKYDVWVEPDGERRCLYAAENAGEVLGQMLGIAVR